MSFHYPSKTAVEGSSSLPSHACGNVLYDSCSPVPNCGDVNRGFAEPSKPMVVALPADKASVDISQVNPLDASTSKKPTRDALMIGLCKSGGPCCEALWCYHCQLSRQYNVLDINRRGVHCGVCCMLWCLDWWSLCAFGKGFQCYLRGRLRHRYHLAANAWGDCCTVCWCRCCALSQTHWEMAMRGDNPGSSCCSSGVSSVTEMR